MPPSRFHIPALDGLRAVAIILVMFAHLPPPPGLPGALGAAFDWLNGHGPIGVDLFFVLSAYLLTRLLILENENYGKVDIGKYFTRRILRIWPLYFTIIAVYFLIFPFFPIFPGIGGFGSAEHQKLITIHLVPFLLFLENFAISFFGAPSFPSLGVLWSLSAEEQFYLVLPAIFLLLSGLSSKAALRLGIGILVYAVALRCYLVSIGGAYQLGYVNPVVRPDAFLAGMAVAYLQDRPWFRRLSHPLVPLAAIGVIATVTPYPMRSSTSPWFVWIFTATALGFALTLGHLLAGGWLSRVLANPFLVWTGRISFGMYVLHQVGFRLVEQLFIQFPNIPWPNGQTMWLGAVVGCFAMTYLLAGLSYYGFERYFIRLKHRFERVPSRAD